MSSFLDRKQVQVKSQTESNLIRDYKLQSHSQASRNPQCQNQLAELNQQILKKLLSNNQQLPQPQQPQDNTANQASSNLSQNVINQAVQFLNSAASGQNLQNLLALRRAQNMSDRNLSLSIMNTQPTQLLNRLTNPLYKLLRLQQEQITSNATKPQSQDLFQNQTTSKWQWQACQLKLKCDPQMMVDMNYFSKNHGISCLAPTIVLSNPLSETFPPIVTLNIDLERGFLYNQQQGKFHWHKSWNLPNISMNLQVKDPQTREPLHIPPDLYVRIFAVKIHKNGIDCQEEAYDLGLKGKLQGELRNGYYLFCGIKFSTTSYYHQGAPFRLIVCIFSRGSGSDQGNRVLISKISPPIFVDSRKLAKDSLSSKAKRYLTMIRPFDLQLLESTLYKRTSKNSEHSLEELITPNIQGLFEYFSAPNIRNKVRHPLYLIVKFNQCCKLYYDKTQTKSQTTVDIIEELQYDLAKNLPSILNNKLPMLSQLELANSDRQVEPKFILLLKNFQKLNDDRKRKLMETLSFPNFYNIVLMRNKIDAEKLDRYAVLDSMEQIIQAIPAIQKMFQKNQKDMKQQQSRSNLRSATIQDASKVEEASQMQNNFRLAQLQNFQQHHPQQIMGALQQSQNPGDLARLMNPYGGVAGGFGMVDMQSPSIQMQQALLNPGGVAGASLASGQQQPLMMTQQQQQQMMNVVGSMQQQTPQGIQAAGGQSNNPMMNSMLLNALGRQAGCTGGSGLMNVLQNAQSSQQQQTQFAQQQQMAMENQNILKQLQQQQQSQQQPQQTQHQQQQQQYQQQQNQTKLPQANSNNQLHQMSQQLSSASNMLSTLGFQQLPNQFQSQSLSNNSNPLGTSVSNIMADRGQTQSLLSQAMQNPGLVAQVLQQQQQQMLQSLDPATLDLLKKLMSGNAGPQLAGLLGGNPSLGMGGFSQASGANSAGILSNQQLINMIQSQQSLSQSLLQSQAQQGLGGMGRNNSQRQQAQQQYQNTMQGYIRNQAQQQTQQESSNQNMSVRSEVQRGQQHLIQARQQQVALQQQQTFQQLQQAQIQKQEEHKLQSLQENKAIQQQLIQPLQNQSLSSQIQKKADNSALQLNIQNKNNTQGDQVNPQLQNVLLNDTENPMVELNSKNTVPNQEQKQPEKQDQQQASAGAQSLLRKRTFSQLNEDQNQANQQSVLPPPPANQGITPSNSIINEESQQEELQRVQMIQQAEEFKQNQSTQPPNQSAFQPVVPAPMNLTMEQNKIESSKPDALIVSGQNSSNIQAKNSNEFKQQQQQQQPPQQNFSTDMNMMNLLQSLSSSGMDANALIQALLKNGKPQSILTLLGGIGSQNSSGGLSGVVGAGGNGMNQVGMGVGKFMDQGFNMDQDDDDDDQDQMDEDQEDDEEDDFEDQNGLENTGRPAQQQQQASYNTQSAQQQQPQQQQPQQQQLQQQQQNQLNQQQQELKEV